MDFLYIIVIWLAIFTVFILIISIIISRRKNSKIKKQLKTISTESKLIAIDELRKLIRRDPYNIEAREKLAELLIQNKSYLPAVKEYLSILDRFQNISKDEEIKYLNKIGSAYMHLGNVEDARKYFLISKSKDDINYETNLNLADIEMKDNNFEKAETYYSLANKIEPENLDLLKPFGICYFKLNKFKNAAEKFLKYLKEKKIEDLEVLYFLGYSFYNLNKYDDALKFFIRLKQSSQYAAESFYIMGKIHKEQNLFVKAIEEFENSLMAGQFREPEKLVEINYLLAESYFSSHEIHKAVEYWNKAANINPTYKDVQEKLQNYSIVNKNQLLEMYLVGSINQFTNICKYIAKYYVAHFATLKGNVKFLNIKTTQEGSLEMVVEVTSGNFLELNFFVFIRSATTVGDMVVRQLYNTLKEEKADKGICITAGAFSDSAKEFVETRMLKIVEREKLVDILEKIAKNLKINHK